MKDDRAIVLDACAIIAFLRGEPGAEIVRELLEKEPPVCMAHAVNVCEVFYDFLRTAGESDALDSIITLRSIGVAVKEDMDEAFWQQAGRHKVACKVSLADAFALALTERYEGELVTSDRREFEPVQARGVVPITFIR